MARLHDLAGTGDAKTKAFKYDAKKASSKKSAKDQASLLEALSRYHNSPDPLHSVPRRWGGMPDARNLLIIATGVRAAGRG